MADAEGAHYSPTVCHHGLDECGTPLWWCLVQPLVGAMVIVPDDTTVSVVDMAGA